MLLQHRLPLIPSQDWVQDFQTVLSKSGASLTHLPQTPFLHSESRVSHHPIRNFRFTKVPGKFPSSTRVMLPVAQCTSYLPRPKTISKCPANAKLQQHTVWAMKPFLSVAMKLPRTREGGTHLYPSRTRFDG